MVLSSKMITGFNTDVQHEGQVYHVQTEDNDQENPFFESLVYVGGTIIARKRTPYAEQLSQGAKEEMIASLLKRQHQVVIAAIKAGRVKDLIRHSANELHGEKAPVAAIAPPQSRPQPDVANGTRTDGAGLPAAAAPPPAINSAGSIRDIAPAPVAPPDMVRKAKSAGLDLNEVISDYLKRSSEQTRLDLKVLTPRVFTSGKSISLNIQVSYGVKPEPEAVVTVKVIGTAFRPQVFMGRAGRDGIASFSLTLPTFTTGTAAIVIEAQSNRGRGELKNLIRRA